MNGGMSKSKFLANLSQGDLFTCILTFCLIGVVICKKSRNQFQLFLGKAFFVVSWFFSSAGHHRTIATIVGSRIIVTEFLMFLGFVFTEYLAFLGIGSSCLAMFYIVMARLFFFRGRVNRFNFIQIAKKGSLILGQLFILFIPIITELFFLFSVPRS